MIDQHQVAVVDLDNTLFDFATPFYERASKLMPYPTPDKWDHWDVHTTVGMPDKKFCEIVDTIHRDQMQFSPFPGAKGLMDALFENYLVVVASHRNPTVENYRTVLDWLTANKLPFDFIHVGHDKVGMIDAYCPFVKVIFDDCPGTIRKCLSRNIDTWTIKFPWNEGIEGCNYARDMKDMVMTFKAVNNLNTYNETIFSGRDIIHDNTSC